LDGHWFGERFRYWYGASGRRYLFSKVTAADVTDSTDAIVLVAGADPDRPVFVGTTAPRQTPAETVVYVHLLAATEAERQAIVADLMPPS
ncbi:hypothetical protein J8J40_23055, partial [Mycobacterium tuberculosis]|nr:hypothetical protein [Mycobacterium tuberculosis]MBP0649927.1 hypothetical protein [Mycobacterium tuberculosis]